MDSYVAHIRIYEEPDHISFKTLKAPTISALMQDIERIAYDTVWYGKRRMVVSIDEIKEGA